MLPLVHVQTGRGKQPHRRYLMSRYELPGKENRYHITVGWDNTLPVLSGSIPGTLFAQVEDTESDDEGDGLLVWIGQGVDEPISDVQVLVKAVGPYGNIPLATQVDLLRDMDRDWPRPEPAVGSALATICQQSPLARLMSAPEQGKSYFILLDENGWQLREWQSLKADDYERTFARMVLRSERDLKQYAYAESVLSYVSDPSIILRVHPMGLILGLPVFAILGRGVPLSGPVVIAGLDHGLSANQVKLIAREVFFVEESIRASVTSLCSHIWATIESRYNVPPHTIHLRPRET